MRTLGAVRRSVAVVAHSHWDREWYAPFETYRSRLVAMVDGLLDLLESDPSYAHFHLDGQVAVVDDYLEVRPEAADRIRRLVTAGRLAVGPWYVLMDEFCVSAETVVRNLQRGLRRAAELGADPQAGYLPDMFGHVSQMPQLLRRAGLAHAVVWRGVPAVVRASAFWWRAPDGSRVRAEYLPVGYAGGAFLPKDAGSLLRRLGAHEEEIAAFLGRDRPMLLMNGGDHQSPQPWLPALLAEAGRAQDRFDLHQATLDGYLAQAPTAGLPTWAGELRSSARAPILMGTLSNRVDIKQAAAAAETALERTAEPLAVLWLPPDLWPAERLDRAWLEMIRNSAHDSICGCSADEVGRAVLSRYDTVAAISTEVTAGSVAIAGVATAGAGTVVVNPSARDRAGLVEIDVAGTGPVAGGQVLSVTPAGCEERTGVGADLAALLAGLAADGWLGRSGRGVGAALADPDDGDGLVVTIVSDETRTAEPAMAATMAEAWARAGAGARRPLTVRVERAASRRVLTRVIVPGFGWTLLDADGAPPAELAPAMAAPPVTVTAGPAPQMANGLVTVTVDPATGTFAVDDVAGFNRIVEDGDAGDTYNYCPVPGGPVVDGPETVDVAVVESGPLRAQIRVTRRYRWPHRLADGGRVGADPVEVVSDIECHAGDPAVRVTTSFHHHHRDHRVRVHFPLPERSATSEAECAFATVTRGGAEGGPMEAAMATFPSRRFVSAGGLTVTHQGLLEYELCDGGGELALTLLRATGVLSRPAPATRPNVAGPPLPVADTQLPGPRVFRYALALWHPDPWMLADSVWTPLVTAPAAGHGHLPAAGTRLRVAGGEVSALRRAEDATMELRVFNPSPMSTTVWVPGHAGWLVDLRGRPEGRWEDSFPLEPWEIATARLDATSLDATSLDD